MQPAIRHDRSALRWIRGELDQSLREARTALEDFAEGQGARLEQCAERLHHVRGALEMVQVYGGAMLVDEMEKLALALSTDQIKHHESAAEAMMLGMVQLPAYLEKVEAGGADVPLALLPLMNDLRAARDEPLVSETSLFAPKLNAVIAAETVRPGSGNRELPNLINQHRSQYHRGLLNWFRNQHVDVSLGKIRDVLDALNSAAGTARFRRLLDAAEALTVSLTEDDAAPALAVKPLYGKLDRVFKQVIDQGEEAAMLDFPVDLLKNLLYYISRSSSRDPAVVAVQHSADLVNSFTDQSQTGAPVDALGAPDRELFNAVGEALGVDLRDVKDQLDLYIRGDRAQLSRLTDLAAPIQRIGDTLGMVGRGELRGRLKHFSDELVAAGDADEAPHDDHLMALASELLYVESSLANLDSAESDERVLDEPVEGSSSQMLSAGEMRQHQHAAIDEALRELSKSKDEMLEFFEQPGDPGRLGDVPTRLHMVAGVLSMLEMPEAGQLLHDLKPYIARLETGEQTLPDTAQRDALADVVMSAELFMQTVLEPGPDRQHLLTYAHRALVVLGMREADAQPVDLADRHEQVDQLDHAQVVDVDDAVSGQDTDTQDDAVAVVDAEPQLELVSESDSPVEAAPASESVEQADEAQPADVTDEAAASDVDSEILDVFAEEADEELHVIQRVLPQWRNDVADAESLHTARRAFHTLKGSGRIVGADNLGEFAWSLENLLNRVIDGTVDASPALLTLMDEVGDVLPALVGEARTLGGPNTDVSALRERAFELASGEAATPSSEPVIDADTVEVADVPAVMVDDDAPVEAAESSLLPERLELPDDGFVMPSVEFEPAAPESSHEPLSLDGFDQPGDDSLLIESIGDGRRPGTSDDAPADESILTASEVQDSEFSQLDAPSQHTPDTSLNAVFVSEVQGHLKVLDQFLQRCVALPGGGTMEAGVRRAMHTLRGSARTAGADAMADVAGALETFTEAMLNHRRFTDGRSLDLLNRSHGMLQRQTAQLDDPQVDVGDWEALRDEIHAASRAIADEAAAADSQLTETDQPAFDPELLEVFLDEAKELLEGLDGELRGWEDAAGDDAAVARLQRNLHTMKGGARMAGVTSVGDLSHALESVFESVVEKRIDGDGRLKRLVRNATDSLAHDIDALVRGGVPGAHPDIVERLENAARGRDWDDVGGGDEPSDDSSLLTTAEVPVVAEEVDDAPAPFPDPASPNLVEENAEPPETELEPASGERAEQDIRAGTDAELLSDSQLLTDSELLGDSSFQALIGDAPDDPDRRRADSPSALIVPFPGGGYDADDDGFVQRKPIPDEPPEPVGGNERIRVASGTLDQMVNNAGEVTVYRARIEQQNSSVAFNLNELQQTIERLRGQLRNLEIETEAQILSRHERDDDVRADFDPLELDRYSTIQQLSRALSETVEDLSSLGQSLNDLNRDTDTLLLQQARVTTDLQDGLLRTRMVRFASRVPRLERIVRQTCHTVGKQADLEIVGGDEDMDRAILERIMGPLEHLLRNAVSHGIEEAQLREENGKSGRGLITLGLAREGTDVVLTLADDGRGLDRERIRTKAIERGLLEADADVEDDDLYQMILQPGFSTAKELSQVSGRGVGMDVVLTEVKQLGGVLDITSQPGHGTSFTIRLPFTLAITDALLVMVNDEYFAVPHSSIDGVARIDVDELRAIYSGQQDVFAYGGRDYTMRYLGSMLGVATPSPPEGIRWIPVLLARSGEHRVAIQVDGLLGNRQIVVKSIGAQLSGVRWFTGGTILADGQIALIIDTHALIRLDSAHHAVIDESKAEPVGKGVSVMVVDDSITVRKVTSRLLERHNMQVVTAKDGVDAVTLLQETHPDVMLLDIEMPRMDGFELARHMHSMPELADIPIIMITSRTGDKHRDRALELGVKRYLGKPYQEAELLENIYTVLAETAL